MNRITYHPNGYKHEAVAKVKRMLTKIGKEQINDSSFFIIEQLTGVEQIDAKSIKYLVEKQLRNLKNEIENRLKENEPFLSTGENNPAYEEYFYLSNIQKKYDLVNQLDAVYQEIKKYPMLEIKTWEYIFNATNEKEKFEEIKQYLEKNSFDGWLKEYFSVDENRNKKRIFPLFFSPTDLTNATSILCEYF